MRISPRLADSVKGIQQLIKHDLNILIRDKYSVKVRGGNGGLGLARYDGCGGRGGNVFFVPRQPMAFSDIPNSIGKTMKITAKCGESSMKTKLVGSNAYDTLVDVPLGVEIVNEESGELVARCEKAAQLYLIAKGGEGGRRENQFKSGRGEEVRVGIHVKLRPNIALLGFPNAGKSTLMKALVPAKKVKIASYAFTTTHPQVAFYKDESESSSPFTLSIADLPGIIEGASQNRGRGLSFLKHLQYADMVLVVVDCNGFQLKNDLNEEYRSAVECLALVNREVEQYDVRLIGSKKWIVVLNKMDVCRDTQSVEALMGKIGSGEWLSSLPASLPPSLRPLRPFKIDQVVALSAKSGHIDVLKSILREKAHLVPANNRID